MNIFDAAKILGLSGKITPDDVKNAYRQASKKYHPDINPAGTEMMKVVNEAYEWLGGFSGEIKEEQTDYGDLFNEALNAVFGLSGLTLEICGVWLWVTGDTFAFKNTFKNAGFKWASKKKAWYFRPEQFRSYSRGKFSLEEIRGKYGSDTVKFEPRASIGV